MNRRTVLAGAAAGGGLLVAYVAFGSLEVDEPPLAPGRGEYAFGPWIKIGTDGVVTVAVPQLEMGQGVTTILPQIAAAELGADWRQVAVEPAPPSPAYANVPLAARWSPLWADVAAGLAGDPEGMLPRRFARANAFAATADGTTLAAYERPLREAAATARAMLTEAAADQWDVPAKECGAANGFVTHGDKRLSFAALVGEASIASPPDPPPLRPEFAGERPIAGEADAPTAFPRLDLPAKVDGSAIFAGDVRLPDMLHAAIRHAPLARSARVVAKDVDAPDGIAFVEGPDWIAAVASSWWRAERALDALGPRFGVVDPVESTALDAALDRALRDGEAERLYARDIDDADAPIASPDAIARYDIAPLAHSAIETASATARVADGRLEVWAACQSPESARLAAAEAAGVGEAEAVLYPVFAGGSFDARLSHEHVVQAATIAARTGRPVQLTWSRAQEIGRVPPLSPAAALMRAALDTEGGLAALHARWAMPGFMRATGARLFGSDETGADPLALLPTLPPYAVSRVALDHVPVETALPVGRLRGNGAMLGAFATESFIDEIAAERGREPLSYRIAMLGSDPRLVACLQRAAQLAGWGGGAGQGLACWRQDGARGAVDGARIACIASARRGEGGAMVASLHAAVDIGRIVNLDIARQQVEGGLVFGMGLALGTSAGYSGGWPETRRLGALNLPALADSPEIIVDFIASQEAPADPGELGAIVAPPAIANALHAATGERLRRLPLFDRA